MSTKFETQGGEGKQEVTTIVTCDNTGPLLVTVWPPAVDAFKRIVNEHNPDEGQLKLRFEQLWFSPMQKNEWNGKELTTIRVGHTVNCEKQSPMKKQQLDALDSSLSFRDGTRLSMIRETTSPYMEATVSYSQPQPPLVLTSYTNSLKDVVSPFRATIVGTIHDLEETETTGTGELRRNFKLADENGMWVNCVAHGKHADSALLVAMTRIVFSFLCRTTSLKFISANGLAFQGRLYCTTGASHCLTSAGTGSLAIAGCFFKCLAASSLGAVASHAESAVPNRAVGFV